MSIIFLEHVAPELAHVFWAKYLVIFLLLTLRYTLFAGTAYLLFYGILKRRLFYRKIQQKWPDVKRVWYEIRYSLSTFAIIGLMVAITTQLREMGYTALYSDIHSHSMAYFFISIVLAIFIHDTYFYWSHRLMHHPKLFKHVHKVHHMSHNPTPWAAFSFHPTEAVMEFGFVVPMLMFLPMHPLAVLIFSLYMITLNVMGHLGFELYPKGTTKFWMTKWMNTSTHHNMHHKYVNCNYGLYFNIWDRLMGTNHAKYHETFEAITNREKPQPEQKDVTLTTIV